MINIQINEIVYLEDQEMDMKDKFYKKCNHKANTICIIQSLQGNVFGDFTSLERKKTINSPQEQDHEYDKLAFVYVIRSAKGYIDADAEILSIQIQFVASNTRAIQHYPNEHFL